MVFVLRVLPGEEGGDLSPRRVLRETDEEGTERVFWLLERGRWVVAMRTAEGDLGCTSAGGVRVSLAKAGSLTFVEASVRD